MRTVFPRSEARVLTAGFALLAGALLLGLAAGCGTTSGADPSDFASVTISNRAPQQIASVTTQVFSADGYTGGIASAEQMIFEKPGSRASSIAREGLVGAYYGAQTINRVKVDIFPVGANVYRLQCKAYMVSGGSDPFFQDEVPLANFRSGPYRTLLKKIADKLK
jgi:hypothetical protein